MTQTSEDYRQGFARAMDLMFAYSKQYGTDSAVRAAALAAFNFRFNYVDRELARWVLDNIRVEVPQELGL